MSGICGWFGVEGSAPKPARALEQMARRLSLGRVSPLHASWGPHAGLYANSVRPYVDHTLWATVDGTPNWSLPELAASAEAEGHSKALALAYRRYGSDLLKYIHGPFALAVIDLVARKALLAIDRMGVYRLCYTFVKSTLVFGSTATSVAAHPAVTSSIDPQAVFDYIYFHMIPSPGTIFKEQRTLPPAHALEFFAGAAKSGPYWEPSFTSGTKTSVDELSSNLNTLLRKAVRRCRPDRNTGCFLSGGVDSSTITGVLTEVNKEPARTYTIGFDVESYDETRFSRIVAEHFHTRHSEYYVTAMDVAAAAPKVAAFYDQPFGNASAVAVYYCARSAEADGIELLLAGDGGDELFAGHVRYARQRLLDAYSAVPSRIRRQLVEPLVFGFPWSAQIVLIRKARGYIRGATSPVPGQLYNPLLRVGLGEVFKAELLETLSPEGPAELLAQAYGRSEGNDPLNRFLSLDWKFTLADDDLRKVGGMCELAGVSVRFPLLDEEVVEFSTRIPAALKLKGLTLRYFFKRAMRDFLPDATLAKMKHGFSLPFEAWLAENTILRELALDSLNDLKQRDYFRPAFLELLMDGYRIPAENLPRERIWTSVFQYLIQQRASGHPRPGAELIWTLMMLELWMRAHETRSSERLVDSPVFLDLDARGQCI
jgi:asparagine synthase (glutamine-hydrolysing)